jgi:hypothetical protein
LFDIDGLIGIRQNCMKRARGGKKVKEQKKMIQKCRKSTIAETGFET